MAPDSTASSLSLSSLQSSDSTLDLGRYNVRAVCHLSEGCSLYWGTFHIFNNAPEGPYSRTMPMALWWSWGGGLFLMSEVPL